MSQQATFDDANLILRLYEIRREERMREARRWDLYFATGGELGLVYARVEPVLGELRAATGHPGMYRNLETVARQYGEYLDAQAPGNWEGFKKRTRGMILAK